MLARFSRFIAEQDIKYFKGYLAGDCFIAEINDSFSPWDTMQRIKKIINTGQQGTTSSGETIIMKIFNI